MFHDQPLLAGGSAPFRGKMACTHPDVLEIGGSNCAGLKPPASYRKSVKEL